MRNLGFLGKMSDARLDRRTNQRLPERPPKLSKKGLQILQAFKFEEKLYGLEIKSRTGIFTGTLYPLLRRLASNGWLTHEYEEGSEEELGRPRRIYYRITEEGRQKMREGIEKIEKRKSYLERKLKELLTYS